MPYLRLTRVNPNLNYMKYIFAICALVLALPLQAKTSCDFKGLSVGDKLTPTQAMSVLGVTKFKTNPQSSLSIDEMKKYGMLPAGEAEDWKTGPYCDYNSCKIPYGITISRNIPVSVFVYFNKGQIENITVKYQTGYWEEVVSMLKLKYGTNWDSEEYPVFLTDYETKKSITGAGITLKHKTGGVNAKTRDRCELVTANFDWIFSHHIPLGIYLSIFSIGLISQNM